MIEHRPPARLRDRVRVEPDRVRRPVDWGEGQTFQQGHPVLVLLAAGRGTRFGRSPKCIQPVGGRPLARHTIDAFRGLGYSRVVGVVGYEAEAVRTALGTDNAYVESGDCRGGTGYAAYEALTAPGLIEGNELVVVAMGDRVVPTGLFERLLAEHRREGREAALTFLSAHYPAPTQRGRGRVLRDGTGRVLRIVEQREIDALTDPTERLRLDGLEEGNCPLYVARAAALVRHLGVLGQANSQAQFYVTDIVETMALEGGPVRTVMIHPGESGYAWVGADVTRMEDLDRVERLVARR